MSDESGTTTPAVTNGTEKIEPAEYEIELNASVAVKLAKIAEDHYPGVASGPLYGYNDEEAKLLSVTHTVAFPAQHGSGSNTDDVFNTRGGNSKFQTDFVARLKEAHVGAKLLGWFVSSVGGKYTRQSVIESLLRLQEKTIKEDCEDWPAFVVVYDPSKALDSLLSLKVLKLSSAFLQTWHSEERFVAKNLIDNRLSYKNIFEEVPASVKNLHLTNLKVQELDCPGEIYGEDLEVTSNNLQTTVQTAEQLQEAIDNFNHNLGNFNYYQRNLSREVTKISQWKTKAKQDNADKLKKDPKAKVSEPDWTTQFKLPQPPSKYENIVLSGLVNNYCNNLDVSGSVEHAKVKGIEGSL